MSQSEDWVQHFSDILPEGAVPTSGLRIIRYMNAEGESRWFTEFSGEENLSQTMGTMLHLMHTWMHENEDL